jgi:hypothetical protein
MIKQNLIVYIAGCYGTFFEWMFNFLEDPTIEVPFQSNGNSHNFTGNFLNPKERVFEYINSDRKNRFSRAHSRIFEKTNQHEHVYQDSYDEIVYEELNFFNGHFDKILALSYDQDSVLWQQNNCLDKVLLTEESYTRNFQQYGYTKEYLKVLFTNNPVERVKCLLELAVNSTHSTFTTQNLMAWGKNNIHNFDLWELRELLSFYWFTRTDGEIDAWQKNKLRHGQSMLFVSITDLKKNFLDTVLKSARHFDIAVTDQTLEKLQEIYHDWLRLQKQINKDEFCSLIVESLCNKQPFDWHDANLTIIDEAWIQKRLRDNNILIKCQDLNKLPASVKDFLPLLEYC